MIDCAPSLCPVTVLLALALVDHNDEATNDWAKVRVVANLEAFGNTGVVVDV